MRIQLMSDLHIKHWETHNGARYWSETFPAETQTDADVLVLAGDIVDLTVRDWRWSVNRLQEFAVRYKHVIYVPGNHEFYGTSIAETDLFELAWQSNVDVLSPGKIVSVGDRRFLGGVMFQPAPPKGHVAARHPISDASCIRDFKQQAPAEYRTLRRHLEDKLGPDDIVVTHHAPSRGSLDEQWVDNPCNYWFITDQMQDLIEQKQPALWLHGHVHSRFDYRIGKTRVVTNPKGYPGEGVRFDPKLVLELP